MLPHSLHVPLCPAPPFPPSLPSLLRYPWLSLDPRERERESLLLLAIAFPLSLLLLRVDTACSGMDLYGLQTPDFFRIDDLLDFTNDELFSSSTTDTDNLPQPEVAPGNRSLAASGNRDQPNIYHSHNFTDDLCVPVSIPLLPQNKTPCRTFFCIFFGNFVCDFDSSVFLASVERRCCWARVAFELCRRLICGFSGEWARRNCNSPVWLVISRPNSE